MGRLKINVAILIAPLVGLDGLLLYGVLAVAKNAEICIVIEKLINYVLHGVYAIAKTVYLINLFFFFSFSLFF